MEICGFEIAVKLKEKGFRELCLAYYTNDDTLYHNYSHKSGVCYKDCYLSHNLMPKDSVSGKFVDAPTISQVLKWLRKEKKIHINIGIYPNGWKFYCCSCEKRNNGKFGDYDIYEPLGLHNSYEAAAIAGIEYVLDNLI